MNIRLIAAGVSGVHPNAGGLPGSSTVLHLINGLQAWVLFGSIAAIFIGAALWGIAAHSGNFNGVSRGRAAVFGGVIGAILAGAGPALVNFFFGAGQTVH